MWRLVCFCFGQEQVENYRDFAIFFFALFEHSLGIKTMFAAKYSVDGTQREKNPSEPTRVKHKNPSRLHEIQKW